MKRQPNLWPLTGYELTAENGHQLYVLLIAHGFYVETFLRNYTSAPIITPEAEGSIRWDDPTVGIEWPLSEKPILSTRDVFAPLLADFNSPFIYGENSARILITGGAGFIGSAVVRLAIANGHTVINLDALTYSASLRASPVLLNIQIIHL